MSEKSPQADIPPTAAPANPGSSVATHVHQRNELQEEKRDFCVMNIKCGYKIKGRNYAVMSFGPAANTWDSLPAWQYVRWMLYFLAFRCTQLHTCLYGRDTRGLAQQGQGLKRSSHGNLGTPKSRGSVGASRLSLLCRHCS